VIVCKPGAPVLVVGTLPLVAPLPRVA